MTELQTPTRDLVFKIASSALWQQSEMLGVFNGSPDDHRDGFIHLSTAEQLPGTLEKHFRGQTDLMLIAFSSKALGPTLRWEPSRDGALFPHVYGILPTAQALWSRPLPADLNGVAQMCKELN